MEYPIPKLKNKFITRLISGYFTMRICIIADQIYKSGGIERVLSHRINYWINQGHSVHLITSINNNNKPYFKYHSEMIHHEIISGFDKSVSLFSPSNLALSFKYFFNLKKVVDSIKPDVILMPNYSYDYYFLPLIMRNTYCIKEYHSSFTRRHGLIGKLKNFYTRFYDAHVFLSQEEADLASIPNSVIIPNPITKNRSIPRPLVDRDKVILAAGRISKVKGFDRLIQTWSKIAKQYPDWRLEIYGDGDKREVSTLKNLIIKEGIATNTIVYPSDPEIIDKMLSSRIYAMTSLTECFPMVLLEAMQSGMSIITFDCPTGPRNIITNQSNGLIIEDDSLDKFALNLSKLIDNNSYAQSLASNAYSDSQSYYIENVMKKWDVLLHKVHEVV